MPRTKTTAAEKVPPVRSTRGDIEAEEHVRDGRPRVLSSDGPARQALDPVYVEVVEKPVSKDKLDMLAFMEEPVRILVHDTTDPTAEPLPQVINDRSSQFFIRGQEQTVKRKFIEVLARAKKTTYSQEKFTDANGNESYRNIPHTALRFPFQVIEDTERGKAWLKAILSET